MAKLKNEQRLLVLALALGIVGGIIGTTISQHWQLGAATLKSTVGGKAVVTKDSQTTAEVIKKVSPSVVSIIAQGSTTNAFGMQQSTQAEGTGIIISSDGLIITNKHVVADTQATYSVVLASGKEYKNAKVIARDPLNDIDFVRIDAKDLKPAELGDSSTVAVGQRVIAIGNALGQFQNTATEGIVSGFGRSIQAGGESGTATETLTNLIQTDAAINPGNSGGPLVTTAGQVIGINTAVAGNAQNIGFAIPTSEIKNQIKSVQETGKISRPYLGVRYVQVTPQLATRYNFPVDHGVVLSGGNGGDAVVSGGPADKVGLKAGDIITKLGNDELNADTASLPVLLAKYKVGDTLSVTYYRDGKQQTVKLKLAEAQ